MDPLRIAARCLVVFIFLLTVLRISGKRTIRHGSAFDFVLALIIGDLVDDAIWGEVPLSQFVVASATLLLMKISLTWSRSRRIAH
jgi:uncharacterized membrane protein YcaP (DUF421 family)